MYQIQMMTETFGPVGYTWKYNVNINIRWISICRSFYKILMWIKWYEYGPVCSVQNLSKKNGGLDDEAPKKAMTDAMTKAFSHLNEC